MLRRVIEAVTSMHPGEMIDFSRSGSCAGNKQGSISHIVLRNEQGARILDSLQAQIGLRLSILLDSVVGNAVQSNFVVES
jgi:hypothetical protein